MKQKFFLSTHLYFFLTLIPILGLFVLAVLCHDKVDTVYKMFPLEIATAAGAIFDILYFFRGLAITPLGIRAIGVFSSKDTAVFQEGNTLIFTLAPHRKVKVELFGDRGNLPGFDWLTNGEDAVHEIYLLREKIYATEKQMQSLLTFLGAKEEDAKAALCDDYSSESPTYSLSSTQKNELREIRLTLKVLPQDEDA